MYQTKRSPREATFDEVACREGDHNLLLARPHELEDLLRKVRNTTGMWYNHVEYAKSAILCSGL